MLSGVRGPVGAAHRVYARPQRCHDPVGLPIAGWAGGTKPSLPWQTPVRPAPDRRPSRGRGAADDRARARADRQAALHRLEGGGGVKVWVADSIAQLDPERWDALAGGEIAMSHRWQRAMEASRRCSRPRYVLIEDERGPLAAAVTNLAGEFGRRGWREALLRRLVLAVGATFSSRHCGVAVRAGADPLPPLRRLDVTLAELCRRGTRP